MKKFICTMISDVDGQASSKRFITLCAFFCVVVAFLVNVFMSIPLEEFVFDGMMYLVAAGLGFSTVEKFSRTKAHKVSLDENVNE
jgi:hypothetical protein